MLRSRRSQPIALLLLISFSVCGCGPSEEQAARAVLFCAPAFAAAALGLDELFRALWSATFPILKEVRLPWRSTLAIAFALMGLSMLGLSPVPTDQMHEQLTPREAVLKWVPACFVVAGTSYLAISMVLMRLRLTRDPSRAFGRRSRSLLLLFMLPGIPYAFGYWDSAVLFYFWIYPGYMGVVTAPLLIALVAEAWVRKRHADLKREQNVHLF